MDMKLWICEGGAQAGVEEKHGYVQSLEYEIKDVRSQVSEVTLRLGAPTDARLKVLLHKMDVTGEHMTGLEPHEPTPPLRAHLSRITIINYHKWPHEAS